MNDLEQVLSASPAADLAETAVRHAGGVRQALDMMFAELSYRFRADRANGQSGVFRLDIDSGEGIETYVVTVADGLCAVSRAQPDEVNVTLRMGFADFLKIATGKMSGAHAAMTGKVKVSGSIGYAMRWGDWFGR
jgi:putative sterol carrier protein